MHYAGQNANSCTGEKTNHIVRCLRDNRASIARLSINGDHHIGRSCRAGQSPAQHRVSRRRRVVITLDAALDHPASFLHDEVERDLLATGCVRAQVGDEQIGCRAHIA